MHRPGRCAPAFARDATAGLEPRTSRTKPASCSRTPLWRNSWSGQSCRATYTLGPAGLEAGSRPQARHGQACEESLMVRESTRHALYQTMAADLAAALRTSIRCAPLPPPNPTSRGQHCPNGISAVGRLGSCRSLFQRGCPLPRKQSLEPRSVSPVLGGTINGATTPLIQPNLAPLGTGWSGTARTTAPSCR